MRLFIDIHPASSKQKISDTVCNHAMNRLAALYSDGIYKFFPGTDSEDGFIKAFYRSITDSLWWEFCEYYAPLARPLPGMFKQHPRDTAIFGIPRSEFPGIISRCTPVVYPDRPDEFTPELAYKYTLELLMYAGSRSGGDISGHRLYSIFRDLPGKSALCSAFFPGGCEKGCPFYYNFDAELPFIQYSPCVVTPDGETVLKSTCTFTIGFDSECQYRSMVFHVAQKMMSEGFAITSLQLATLSLWGFDDRLGIPETNEVKTNEE